MPSENPKGELLTWERVGALQRQVDRMEGKLDAVITLGNRLESLDSRVKSLELAAAAGEGSRVSRGKLIDFVLAGLLAVVGSGVWVGLFFGKG